MSKRLIGILIFAVSFSTTKPCFSGYEVLWSGHPTYCSPSAPIDLSFCTGDFDADGSIELAMPDNGVVRIVDAVTGAEEATVTTAGFQACRVVAMDLDADRGPEIIAIGQNALFRVIDFVNVAAIPSSAAPIDSDAGSSIHPNPFNARAIVTYSILTQGRGSLDIYDSAGRLVRTLVSGSMEPGQRSVAWDGRDNEGQGLASGTYFYSLTLDGQILDKGKAVLLK